MRSKPLVAILMVILCGCMPDSAEARRRSKRRRARGSRNAGMGSVRSALSECEAAECAHLVPDENMNCVNKCGSPACFERIYAPEPLEDGEVDDERERSFLDCMLAEQKEQRRRQRAQRKRDQEEMR